MGNRHLAMELLLITAMATMNCSGEQYSARESLIEVTEPDPADTAIPPPLGTEVPARPTPAPLDPPPSPLSIMRDMTQAAASVAIVSFGPPRSYETDQEPWVLTDIDVVVTTSIRGVPPKTITILGGEIDGGLHIKVSDQPRTTQGRKFYALFNKDGDSQRLAFTAIYDAEMVSAMGTTVALADLITEVVQ